MKATITIRKAFQEAQFEPFEITISVEKEVIDKNEISDEYEKILDVLNKKIDERLDAMK